MSDYNLELDQSDNEEFVAPPQPAPQPEPVEPPKAAEAGPKPEWTRGRHGYLSYGDEGPEVDYVNAVFGVDAASYTKATEEAVENYTSQANRFTSNTVGYLTYKRL